MPDELWIRGVGAVVIVVLAGICIYLYRDNEILRDKLLASEVRQATMVDVLKIVTQIGLENARTFEQRRILDEQLSKIVAMERDINVSISQVGHGAAVGQQAAGQNIGQERNGPGTGTPSTPQGMA